MLILHRIPTRLLTRVSGFICPTEGGCGQIIRLFPIFLIRIQATWLHFENGNTKPTFYEYKTKQWIQIE